jgi:hypothetical protein
MAVSNFKTSSIRTGTTRNTMWDQVTIDTAYESIQTITVGSGGVNSVTFSAIPGGYKHLQIRGIAQDNRATYNTSALDMQFNGDGGSNYSNHFIQANWLAGTTDTIINNDINGTRMYWVASITSTLASNTFGAFIIDILDYNNTLKNKTVRAISGADANGDAAGYRPVPRFQSGSWRNTNAVTSITLTHQFGPLISQNSQFALYGIKG